MIKMLVIGLMSPCVFALPDYQGGDGAYLIKHKENWLINQRDSVGIINFDEFHLNVGEELEIVFPKSRNPEEDSWCLADNNAITFIIASSKMNIDGKITSPCRVVLISAEGIELTTSSELSVGSIWVSGLPAAEGELAKQDNVDGELIDNDVLLRDAYRTTPYSPVSLEGKITINGNGAEREGAYFVVTSTELALTRKIKGTGEIRFSVPGTTTLTASQSAQVNVYSGEVDSKLEDSALQIMPRYSDNPRPVISHNGHVIMNHGGNFSAHANVSSELANVLNPPVLDPDTLQLSKPAIGFNHGRIVANQSDHFEGCIMLESANSVVALEGWSAISSGGIYPCGINVSATTVDVGLDGGNSFVQLVTSGRIGGDVILGTENSTVNRDSTVVIKTTSFDGSPNGEVIILGQDNVVE